MDEVTIQKRNKRRAAIPKEFKWVDEVVKKAMGLPKALDEALYHYGTLEVIGTGSHPNIINWAREMGVAGWYTDDDIPWCGLFVGICVKRAGYTVPRDSLRARAWVNYGQVIEEDKCGLGDVMVFWRGTPKSSTGHVCFYIAETEDAYLVYGGNQNNRVGFTWIEKKRLISCHRHLWKKGKPANVKKYFVDKTGKLSDNEQ